MERRFVRRLLVPLLVGVSIASAATADADTLTRFSETIPISGSSECTGDPNIVGTATMIGMERFSEHPVRYSEVSHLSFVAIRAVGSSGTRYVGTHHEMVIQNGSVATGGGLTLTLAVHDVMVPIGGGGVQQFQGLFHVTVNGNGDVTATADRFTLACRG